MKSVIMAAAMFCLPLAGCIESPEPQAEGNATSVVTDPTDYSYVDRDGDGWHVHDYWKGEQQLEILAKTDDCTGCSASSDGTEFPIGWFRPDPYSVVPQGTKFINITLTWEIGSGEYDAIQLYMKTAATSEAEYITDLENGAMYSYQSTNEENDPPHHILSLWEFQIKVDGSGDRISVSDWAIDIDVKAARGLEIPPYPPHPDFWQGQNEILVGNGAFGSEQLEYAPPGGGTSTTCFGGCLGRFSLNDGEVVPFDASTITVRFDYEPEPYLWWTFGSTVPALGNSRRLSQRRTRRTTALG